MREYNLLWRWHTSCWEESVIFLIAPFLQFVRVTCGRKVVLCLVTVEEERAEPDGFVVVVVFGDCDVGDGIAVRSSYQRWCLPMWVLVKNRGYWRAFPLCTTFQHIPCWTAVDDKIVRCVRGVVVLWYGAHGTLEFVKLVVPEIVLETDAILSDMYAFRYGSYGDLPIIAGARFIVSMKGKVGHVRGCLASLCPLFVIATNPCIESLIQWERWLCDHTRSCFSTIQQIRKSNCSNWQQLSEHDLSRGMAMWITFLNYLDGKDG